MQKKWIVCVVLVVLGLGALPLRRPPKWVRFNDIQSRDAMHKCKNCQNIVFLWEDHFRGLLEGHKKAFGQESARKYPLGEKVMMDSLLRALDHLGYTHLLISDTKMFIKYYNRLSGSLAKVFTSNSVMNEATREGLFDSVPRCLFLMLDFWGTMPGVKDDVMVPRFDTSQYLIPYPDNYVNTFMGFTQDACTQETARTENSCLIWGKQKRYWVNQPTWDWSAYSSLKTAFPNMTLHATCADEPSGVELPHDVSNLRPLSRKEFGNKLHMQMFLWGIGQPQDGPSAMEAIACGVPYINTVYETCNVHERRMSIVEGSDTPENKSRMLFDRKSQHKYMETFDEPYVYHVRKNNVSQLIEVVERIIAGDRPRPFVPHDYTWSAYVDRVSNIVSRDWCNS